MPWLFPDLPPELADIKVPVNMERVGVVREVSGHRPEQTFLEGLRKYMEKR